MFLTRDEIEARERLRAEWTQVDLQSGHLGTDGDQIRRRKPRVCRRHQRALRAQPADHRQPGKPEAENEDALARDGGRHVQRNLRVERPNSTRSIVMIQKRTTTWFSFHPFSS